MTDYLAVTPLGSRLRTSLRPPGSKSQTIRALICAALAEGTSRLSHPLRSDDTAVAVLALRQLGVEIEDLSDPWVVVGTRGRLHPSGQPVDAGASGLTARSIIAIAPLVAGPTVVTGRDRLPERPMGGLIAALGVIGVEVTATAGRLPVTVFGKGSLPGGRVEVDSSETTQFLTALLMASPLASTPMTITPVGFEGSEGYVAMTLQMMRDLGATVDTIGEGHRVEASGYVGADIDIEPDASAAVYPMVAAAITGGSVTIEGLGSRSLQPDLNVARVLENMGCVVAQTGDTTTVTASDDILRPVDIDLRGCPDGSLAVAVACLFADGRSTLRGLGSLRHKESDRLVALAAEIERLGAEVELGEDYLAITPRSLRAGRVETYGDHRMAMSFALVGLVVEGIEISNPGVVGKTWPQYWNFLQNLDREKP
jgi:3-phosphoshikimate 1-carboxyvinyltransferase